MGDEETVTPVTEESMLGYHPCSTGFLTSVHKLGLEISAGKEDPVELDSSLTL